RDIQSFLFKADNSLELGDHYFDCLLESGACAKGAVGFDGDAQAVKVGAVANAHVFYIVVNAADWRKDSINRNFADIDALLFEHFARNVAEAALDAELRVDFGLVGNFADVCVGVEEAYLAREFQIFAGDTLGALYFKGDGLCLAREYFEAELFKIKQNGNHVFFNAVDGRKFVRYAVDFNRGDSSAGEAREDNAAKAVTKRVTVARVKA